MNGFRTQPDGSIKQIRGEPQKAPEGFVVHPRNLRHFIPVDSELGKYIIREQKIIGDSYDPTTFNEYGCDC